MSVVSEVTAATRYGVAFWPWAAMVAYALATSTTCGEAVPRTLVRVSSRPAVFSGIPGDRGVLGVRRTDLVVETDEDGVDRLGGRAAQVDHPEALVELVRDLDVADGDRAVAVELGLGADAL